MGKFVYGPASGSVSVTVDDWFLEVFEEVLAVAYESRRPFRIRISDGHDETVLFVTEGVPVSIRYGTAERLGPTERSYEMYNTLREQLETSKQLAIPGSAVKSRTVIYTGSSTAR